MSDEAAYAEADRIAGAVRTLFIEAACQHREFGDDLSRLADKVAIAVQPIVRDHLLIAENQKEVPDA